MTENTAEPHREMGSKAYMDGLGLSKDFIRLINGNWGPGSEAFVNGILGDHRTLQQSTMREVVIPLLRGWKLAQEEGFTDLRNEATVEAARVMIEALEDHGPAGFPLI